VAQNYMFSAVLAPERRLLRVLKFECYFLSYHTGVLPGKAETCTAILTPSWGRIEGVLGCQKSEAVVLIAMAALGPTLSFRGEHRQFLKQEEAVWRWEWGEHCLVYEFA